MLYVRGNPADYDGWAQMVCRGWSYEDVLPDFRKSEHYVSGESEYRGKGGPLLVEDYRTILPLTHRFVEAAQEVGFAFTPDYNGRVQEGVGYSQMTRRGRVRGSTAQTLLAGARPRQNRRGETKAGGDPLPFDGQRRNGVPLSPNPARRPAWAGRGGGGGGGALGVRGGRRGGGGAGGGGRPPRCGPRPPRRISGGGGGGGRFLPPAPRHARRIFAAAPLARHSAAETMPGFDMDSADALIDFIHRAGMNLHHPVGTCRMGQDPPAVVDSPLPVRGSPRLLRSDASVLPTR